MAEKVDVDFVVNATARRIEYFNPLALHLD